MKTNTIFAKCILIYLILFCASSHSQAQSLWTLKQDFPGGVRTGAVAFSLDGQGYVGLGKGDHDSARDIYYAYKPYFWRYNPDSNTWVRIADFPGLPRLGAVSFTIGQTAYVGLGGVETEPSDSDFWAYNSQTGKWSRKHDFPGGARQSAFAFVINNKAYIGCGIGYPQGTYGVGYKDLWQYNADSDTWQRMTDLPGTYKLGIAVFSLGNKAFAAGGFSRTETNSLYEYNSVSNKWIEKHNIPVQISYAIGFSMGNTGYLAFGNDLTGYSNVVYSYDTTLDKWSTIPGYDTIYEQQVSFVINGTAYFCAGLKYNLNLVSPEFEFLAFHDHEASVFQPVTACQTTIYPNPGKGIFTIHSGSKVTFCEVMDVNGHIVYQCNNIR